MIAIKDLLVQEFDLELPFTRRSLERVPLDLYDWKPHERSMSLGWLATFLANIPNWGVMAIEKDEFDPAEEVSGEQPASTKELLDLFDRNYDCFRAVLATTTDTHLLSEWTLKTAGAVSFTQSRWLVLREFILNHIVHHRAQLGVYLRLQGIAVPAIYHDSRDERGGLFRQ